MRPDLSPRRLSLLLLALLALGPLALDDERPSASARADAGGRLRRPVALALTPDGRWLFVANQRGGTVSVLDTATRKAVGEVEVGRRLADLTVTPDGRRLFAIDEAGDELIVLAVEGPRLKVSQRLKVSPAPVSVHVAADGSRCFIASLWSRRLSVIDLVDERPRVVKAIDLPFAPRQQLLLRDPTRLVVADSFGGKLAVVDPEAGTVESVRELPAHNVRGLALSGDGKELWLTHQTLSALAQTTRDDIHWGNLLTNNLRALPLAGLRKPDADLLDGSRSVPLGDVGRGAADPAGFVVAPDGKLIVALAGVDEVLVDADGKDGGQRLAVGKRPTAVALAPGGRRAYVANMFSDSVSVIDLAQGKVEAEIILGTAGELSKLDRGEMLFHSARLTHDGWFSCHSCHTDGHSSGRRGDTLGDGTYGTPKRVPSLLGVGDTGPWAWNGSVPDLATQVRQSVQKTMHGPKPTDEQVGELVVYLRSLAAPPPDRLDAEAVKRGAAVFAKQSCNRCHTPPTYTSPKTYDVGLADEAGGRQFNPPSLRGVGQGGPYFHDGRAATLEEVFTRHRHQLEGKLTEDELRDLIAFLRSL